MNHKLSLLGGIGIGAAFMFLADPHRGRRRRARLKDKLAHGARRGEHAIEATSRDMAHRAQGLLSELRSMVNTEEVSDDVLIARVRSKLGRVVSHPKAIRVMAEQGIVRLEGPVLTEEEQGIIGTVSKIQGVKGLENRLEVHEDKDIPSLQGGALRHGERFELMQQNWSPTARVLAGATGGAMCVYGMSRSGWVGAAIGTVGLGLFARSATNTELTQIIGVGVTKPISIEKTIHINAPIDEVYNFWSHYENFSRLVPKRVEVFRTGEGSSRWIVSGPAGVPIEWEAVTTRNVPNEMIAWRSVSGSMVENSGVVRFDAVPEDITRVHVRLNYSPPAGEIGHMLASMFGASPKSVLEEALAILKNALETGAWPNTTESLPHSKHFDGMVH
jgi:uncharacterized membrane protein